MLLALAVAAHAYLGTTVASGANGRGSVIAWDGHGKVQTLYSFCSEVHCLDGEYPETNIARMPDGSIVGTTTRGGRGDAGTIWQLRKVGGAWQDTTLYSFCNWYQDCGKLGYPRGTLSLVGNRLLMGTATKKDGRGVLWTFHIGRDGVNVFRALRWFRKDK